jgi:hypothetical protein
VSAPGEQHLKQIDANCSDCFAGRITHEEFSARQRSAWDAITASGKSESVLRVIRKRLPGVTP